jgi:hypothetical protein
LEIDFNRRGNRLVGEFYYEKYDYSKDQPREDLKAWDEDGNEICQDLDSLYNYLTENKYFIRLFEERA